MTHVRECVCVCVQHFCASAICVANLFEVCIMPKRNAFADQGGSKQRAAKAKAVAVAGGALVDFGVDAVREEIRKNDGGADGAAVG